MNAKEIKETWEEYNNKRQIRLDANKEKIIQQKKEYYAANKEKRRAYLEANKEKIAKEKRIWYEVNKDKVREYTRTYQNKRRKEDGMFRLSRNLSKLVGNSIKKSGFKKLSKTEIILGCTLEQFKRHIQSKWEPWMNWDNYAKYDGTINYGWDIDHIIPVSSATTEEEIIKLNHYTNLQPLCSYVNRHIKCDSI